MRARGREAFYILPGTNSTGSTSGGPTLLQEVEIGVGGLLILGTIFVVAEVARPVIADVEEIEKAHRGRKTA